MVNVGVRYNSWPAYPEASERYWLMHRPELRWRQTHVDGAFVSAFMRARDEYRRTGRKALIEGFRGWTVSKPREDLT